MLNNLLKKESFVYGLGHILTRLVTFLLLPFFTNIFSPHDYGIISLIYIFLGFFTVLIHLGLDAALLKYYKQSTLLERPKILTNIYIPLLIINILFFGTCFLLKNYLSIYLLGIFDPLLFVLVLIILFFDVLWAMPMIVLRSENRPFLFVAFNMINVLSNLFFIYLFVVTYDLSVLGVVLGSVASSGLLFIITFYFVFKSLSISSLDYYVFKKTLKFGFPLVFAGLFSMIIELSDRYIIRYLLDIEMVGIYNAGYKLGMLMLLVVMGFNMAWQPFFLTKENQNDHARLASISNTVFLFFSIICFSIICFVSPLTKIDFLGYKLVGSAFGDSVSIVPWICAGYLFHGAYILQLPGPYITNNTFYIAIVRGIGAITNIVLNFILIPILGIKGAAISTFIAFFSMAISLFVYNKKIYRIDYNLYNIFWLTIALFGVLAIIETNPSFFIRLIIFTMLLIFLLFLGVIKKQNIEYIKNQLMDLLRF